jgi:hypothetical protein
MDFLEGVYTGRGTRIFGRVRDLWGSELLAGKGATRMRTSNSWGVPAGLLLVI